LRATRCPDGGGVSGIGGASGDVTQNVAESRSPPGDALQVAVITGQFL
jgi:hypothetical protein